MHYGRNEPLTLPLGADRALALARVRHSGQPQTSTRSQKTGRNEDQNKRTKTRGELLSHVRQLRREATLEPELAHPRETNPERVGDGPEERVPHPRGTVTDQSRLHRARRLMQSRIIGGNYLLARYRLYRLT